MDERRRCDLHADQKLKYFCVDAFCNQKERLACAECQVEEPHHKHDFKTISVFKSTISDIASSCSEYLLNNTNKKRIINTIREQFEYMRVYSNEIINQLEQKCISQIEIDGSNQQINTHKQEETAEKLIDQLHSVQADSLKEGDHLLRHHDHHFLANLYLHKDKLYKNSIHSFQSYFIQIAKLKVALTNLLLDWKESIAFDPIIQQQKEVLNQVSLEENQSNIQNKQNETNKQCEPSDENELSKRSETNKSTEINNLGFYGDREIEISKFEGRLVKQITVEQKVESDNLSVRMIRVLDDLRLILVMSDHSIRVCLKDDLSIQSELKGHNWNVMDLILLNYNYLVTCSADTTIKVWDILSNQLKQSIRSHFLEVSTLLLFNQDCIISSGKDYIIVFHSIARSHLKTLDPLNKQNMSKEREVPVIIKEYQMQHLSYPVRQLSKLNDMFFLVGYSHGVVVLADFIAKTFLYSFQDEHALGLYSLATLDAQYFLSYGGEATIKFWNSSILISITQFKAHHSAYIKTIRAIPNSKLFICSADNNLLFLSYASLISKKETGQTQKLLKVLSLSLPKHTQINDFILTSINKQSNSISTIIIATDSFIYFYQ